MTERFIKYIDNLIDSYNENGDISVKNKKAVDVVLDNDRLNVKLDSSFGSEFEIYKNSVSLRIYRYPKCCGIGILSIPSSINEICLKELLKEVVIEQLYSSEVDSLPETFENNFKFENGKLKEVDSRKYSRIEYVGYRKGTIKFLENFGFKKDGNEFKNTRSSNVLQKCFLEVDNLLNLFTEEDYELTSKKIKELKEAFKKAEKEKYLNEIRKSEYYLKYLEILKKNKQTKLIFNSPKLSGVQRPDTYYTESGIWKKSFNGDFKCSNHYEVSENVEKTIEIADFVLNNRFPTTGYFSIEKEIQKCKELIKSSNIKKKKVQN